jgi:hypothetical protein
LYIFIVSLNFKIGKTIFGKWNNDSELTYIVTNILPKKINAYFLLINFTIIVFSISKRSMKMSYMTNNSLQKQIKWEKSYTHYKNVILPSSNPSWGVGVVSIVVWATIILLYLKFHLKTYPTQHLKNLCSLFI